MTEQTQCDSCAFLLVEDQSTHEKDRNIEAKYIALRSILKAPAKPRHIFMGGTGDKTETCFIDSPIFQNDRKTVHCPDRLDNALSLTEAVTLREAKLANSIATSANIAARDARIWAIVAVVIAAIAIVVPYSMKTL